MLSADDMRKVYNTPARQERLRLQLEISALGSVLRDARIAAGLTQDELAKKADVGRRTVIDVESGLMKDGPRVATYSRLLHACGKRIKPGVVDLEPIGEILTENIGAPALRDRNGRKRNDGNVVVLDRTRGGRN